MDELAIETRAVTRGFGKVSAVTGASLSVAPGSVCALIGPNGSGKTTLMLMLATLLNPSSGDIRIFGMNPATHYSQIRALMGWMPDAMGMWSTLTVRRSLETSARLYKMTKPEAQKRATELININGLESLANQPARVLSRGQSQKLNLARALVHRPKLLLLDEPASGLDPVARSELRVLLRKLASEGTAILISSHVLAELDDIADEAVYIHDGKTVDIDRVTTAKARSRNWRIRSLHPESLIQSVLDIGIEANRISSDNKGTLVSFADETTAARALTALITQGVVISDFSPAIGDMEHTLMGVTENEAAGKQENS